MMVFPDAILVTDTSVLVNFLRIDRMELLGALPCRFIVTDHAAGELTDFYPEQVERYRAALAAGHVEACTVTNEAALNIFGQLTGTTRLGVGESATIAHAMVTGAGVAIDDRRAINEAQRIAEGLVIVRTADLMVRMIEHALITVAQADTIKDDWAANHRFRIPVASFTEMM
ncbi:putative nucleic acid-binding protein [Sphingomonas sp. SORGH_AS870]|uniref:hypothetical protein n=1 Tax=Sphingomonas sp. SORGH_AS_0870 TaxID=3041801 RepID=UPI00285DAFAC|nr:hypothetical protein [Sphingomonas sp. SORGH_AS_0870]MDR6147607.1 putative nucleic acid-binding protein [Sphingomonas sp. SORGH_AS_0870]